MSVVLEKAFGPYQLVKQLAVGGMAEVYLAKTNGIAGFEKYLAIKMLHPELIQRQQMIQMLVDEAKLAVQLNHRNIAQTLDLGRVGDRFYITMEYVDGVELFDVLCTAAEAGIDMPIEACAFIAKEMCSALDYAHHKHDAQGRPLNVVHRDVSPQNVLVSTTGDVKLIDFGIAKAATKEWRTAAGAIPGKYYYLSPEQAACEPVDSRTDIFAAGIVLYEMLAGEMLYRESDMNRLLDRAREADIAPPSTIRRGIPPQLERIVMKALAKRPSDRYQRASEMVADLERVLHGGKRFGAAQLSELVARITGEVTEVDEPIDIVTHNDVVEIRDENSLLVDLRAWAKREADVTQNSTPFDDDGSTYRQAPRFEGIMLGLPTPDPRDEIRLIPGLPAHLVPYAQSLRMAPPQAYFQYPVARVSARADSAWRRMNTPAMRWWLLVIAMTFVVAAACTYAIASATVSDLALPR